MVLSFQITTIMESLFVIFLQIGVGHAKFGVTAIPTLLFFNNGKLVDGIVEVQGRRVMTNGIMVGNYGEAIIKETISKLN
jgi:hypothetical protein